MISIISLTLLLSLVAFLLNILLPWIRHVQIAKTSGLSYVVVPFYSYNRVTSLLMSRTLLRLANQLLSEPSSTSWRSLVTSSWPWKIRYAPFARLGTDTFLTVAPGGIIMHTADADVIAQIMARGVDFPKASHLYRTVDIYGENVIAAEGATWRRHRKLTSPLFSERNNQLVWKQTLELCQETLETWLSGQNRTIRTVAEDSMRLSLAVIGRAGLGQKMEWPSASAGSYNAVKEELPKGHTMTFTASLTTLLQSILYIIILPKWFLRIAPFEVTRKSYQSYSEWGLYMNEMIATKRSTMQLEKGDSPKNDLLSQLVREYEGGSGQKPQGRIGLSESEILGNLFVMIIAGHETSASSIHFSLILLALHPQVQKEVQNELDDIFKGRQNPSQWDYESDLPSLLNSKLAAVLNEELRLFAPTMTIPKISTSTPQHLTVDGKDITVPAKTMIRLCVPSVHRNPKFWPHSRSEKHSEASSANDLEEFKLERWLRPDRPTASLAKNVDTESIYVPKKGAYIPFSDGARACLGRRFAQVEILAALALIMSRCSIELAVDEWATDEEVEKMTGHERKNVWRKAEEKANWTLQNKMACIITLKLRGAHVPVRVVRRGEERFMD
jgi:cytochrome P450